MATEETNRRPFKVWSGDRRLRKAVVAATLDEFLDNACAKLGCSHQMYRSEIRAVLEMDGTDIDNDYFAALPRDSVILVLLPNEFWVPPSVDAIKTGPGRMGVPLARDTVDATEGGVDSGCKDAAKLIAFVVEDVSRVLLLTDEQLQIVSRMESFPDRLPLSLCTQITEYCDRQYLLRREAAAAADLVRLVQRTDQPDSSKMTRDASSQTDTNPKP